MARIFYIRTVIDGQWMFVDCDKKGNPTFHPESNIRYGYLDEKMINEDIKKLEKNLLVLDKFTKFEKL